MKTRLVDTYGTYNLFKTSQGYYALSNEIKISDAENIIDEKKAIHANTRNELVEIIKEIDTWADSRGNYENDKSKYLRANSFNVYEEKIAKNYKNPVLIKTKDGIFAIETNNKLFGELQNPNKNLIESKDIKNYKFLNSLTINAVPELIFAYKQFNIIELDKIYYGVPIKLGNIDLRYYDLSSDNDILKGDTIKNVMNSIDKLSIKNSFAEISKIITLIKKLINFFLNIIGYNYNDKKITRLNYQLNKKITKVYKNSFNKKNNPKFIKNFLGYKVFLFEDLYFAIPLEEDFDFLKSDLVSNPNILYDASIDSLEVVIQDSNTKKK